MAQRPFRTPPGGVSIAGVMALRTSTSGMLGDEVLLSVADQDSVLSIRASRFRASLPQAGGRQGFSVNVSVFTVQGATESKSLVRREKDLVTIWLANGHIFIYWSNGF